MEPLILNSKWKKNSYRWVKNDEKSKHLSNRLIQKRKWRKDEIFF